MIRFHNGPATLAGTLLVRRAPLFLRVTHNAVTGQWDALDQLNDTPAQDEVIYAYRRIGEAGTLHVDGRDRRGKRFGRWYQIGYYEFIDPQPSDAILRDKVLWQQWAIGERKGQPT